MLLAFVASFLESRAAETSLDRVIREAEGTKAWAGAVKTSAKMNVIRDVCLSKATVSNPVSDRYLITALGGPIDLVHFFGLAIPVCSGKQTRDDALVGQWFAEGGLDYEAGKSRVFPPEAHPDDLPSNALGALFGEEVMAHENDPAFDVVKALREFLDPLEIVGDDVAKRFSHRTIVMGLAKNASRETVRSRSEWFTAEPMFSLHAWDAERAKTLGSASNALILAGFELREIGGRLIAIDRVK